MTSLSLLERMFVDYYLGECGGNASEAARRAGYAHPNVMGTRKLNNPRVRAAIDARLAQYAMPANEVLARISEIAAGNLGDFIEINANGGFSFDLAKAKKQGKLPLLKKLKNKKETRLQGDDDVVSEQMEIELHDPLTALDRLGRYYGLFRDKEDAKADTINPLVEEIRKALGKPSAD